MCLNGFTCGSVAFSKILENPMGMSLAPCRLTGASKSIKQCSLIANHFTSDAIEQMVFVDHQHFSGHAGGFNDTLHVDGLDGTQVEAVTPISSALSLSATLLQKWMVLP